MGVLIRSLWDALRRRASHETARGVARRIALAQPGVHAVDLAVDEECPMLRIAVHLHIAAGLDPSEVALGVEEKLYRELPIDEAVVRVVSMDPAVQEIRTSR